MRNLLPKTLVRRIRPGIGHQPVRKWLPRLRRPGAPMQTAGLSLGRIGSLEVRLARSGREVRAAQRLRYEVFYEEMSAIPDGRAQATRRDSDGFDSLCDHLLVFDHDQPAGKLGRTKPKIVGTYRLMRQDVAEYNDGFYSAGEFDVQPVLDAHPGLRFLELGRSCVLKPYRNKRTVELLWHGVWAYVHMHKIDVMLGCASLEGTDPNRLDLALSFLHHNCRAPEDWRVRALDERYVDMNMLRPEAVDQRQALRTLPPLIKGYLRLGAYVGDGAVIDRQFGTTDVMIIMPVSRISQRYVNHYGAEADRYAN